MYYGVENVPDDSGGKGRKKTTSPVHDSLLVQSVVSDLRQP
jgi:hypothetical protein